MLVVLTVIGLAVYLRFRSELDHTIELNLRADAASLAPQIERSPAGLSSAVRSPLFKGHESFVQVLDAHGMVLGATPELGHGSLLSAPQLSFALRRTVMLSRSPSGSLSEGSRLLATPVEVAGAGRGVLVVGATLDERDNALSNLATLLAIVGPLALLLASLAAWWMAAAALRPVELMRRRADAVTASEPGRRLPLPRARDEIRRLALTLNGMLDRLESSFEREKSFTANASHELRTPLATLKTELELALRRPRSTQELRDTVQSAEQEVDRLSRLADDLLMLARADEGSLQVRRRQIDVAELLEHVRERHIGRELKVLSPGADVHVEGDPDRLGQALENLLENAVRYGAGTVTLRAAASEHGVELHVEDEGPGFPEGFIAVAFERFTRADETHGGPGAGLGLSIVRAVARAHGGEAHVANRPTGGADAWLLIPGSRRVGAGDGRQ